MHAMSSRRLQVEIMDYYVNCFAKIERETTWFLVSDRLETSDFSESNIHPALVQSQQWNWQNKV